MRKKKDGCFEKIKMRISDSPLVVKVKETKERIKHKVTTSPAYIAFLQKRDKLANHILNGLLAFFSSIAPCWTFLFVKRPDESSEDSKKTK